jgi:SAM-dependent methyltransferase
MPLPPASKRPPVLANERFKEHVDRLAGRDPADIFTYIFDTNLWGSDESTSGVGSQLDATAVLRAEIPALLRRRRARTLLDLPCGDFGWLAHAELGQIDYTGADIVASLVERNARLHGGPQRRFVHLDLIADPLPRADVVLCRDCLVHLNYAQIFAAFANLRRSRSRLLLTTTFVELDANADVDTGDWRPLNLCLPPFGLPEPEALIVEGCTELDGAYADKALGLWRVSDLPEHPRSVQDEVGQRILGTPVSGTPVSEAGPRK